MRAERLMRGGRPRGAVDWWTAGGLRLLQGPYTLGAWAKDRWVSAGRTTIAPEPAGCRVISVGNLTLGGSGKTPLTLALAQMLQKEGRRLAIVLRGYGGSASKEDGAHLLIDCEGQVAPELDEEDTRAAIERFGDEAVLYALQLDGVAVITSRRRADGVALAASGKINADTVLLDDGFQHRAQARGTNVLIMDASLPPAAYEMFPRGYLREQPSAGLRATAIATRETNFTAAQHAALYLRMHPDASVPVLRFDRSPAGCWDADAWSPGELLPVPVALDAAALAAPSFWFAGIAHPDRFVRSLRTAGLTDLRGGAPLGDHAAYTNARLARLALLAERAGATQLFTTEKDAVRLLGRWPVDAPPLLVLSERVQLFERDRWLAHLLADAEDRAPLPESSTSFQPAAG